MKKIKLTQEQHAIIDDEDYEFLQQWNWYAQRFPRTYYAYASDYSKGKNKKVKMHRLLIDIPDGMEVDHINGNGLDNRKSNLRAATRQQNTQNRKPVKGKYCGASWHTRDKVWQSYITVNGKRKHLGYYDDEIDAAKAYDREAVKCFGEFARLNFPEEPESVSQNNHPTNQS